MNIVSHNVEVIISQLQSITIKQLQSIYPDYFTSIEEHVLSLADKAKDNESQWKFFALARLIKQQKKQLGQRMDQSVLDAFVKFRMGTLSGKSEAADVSTSLSLIKDEDFERTLAVSSFARRAESRYMEELYTLNQRMAFLLGGQKLADDGNPIAPHQLAQSLTYMLDPLSLDTHMLRTCSRIFEKQSVKSLKSLYEDSNQLLISKGFLPHLKYSVTKKVSSKRAGSVPDDQGISNDNTSGSKSSGSTAEPAPLSAAEQAIQHCANNTAQARTSGGAEYQQHLIDNIFQIQQQARSPSIESFSSNGAPQASDARVNASAQASVGNFAAIPDVSRAFGQGAGHSAATINLLQEVDEVRPAEQELQLFDSRQLPSLTKEDYRNVSMLISAKAESENASADSLNAIDLVGKIFEYMLSDDQLPDAVKAVLSYLHTPFLKIALTDKDFLRDVNHPAKRLLDSLAEAGKRWVNNDGKSQLRIFPKIKEIVRHLMVEFSEHPEIVLSLCLDIEEFNLKTEEKVRLLENRARSKSEGEEQLRLIKRQAYKQIKSLVGDSNLPAPVLVLIFHPLADYLTLMGLRFGVDSKEWLNHSSLITYLVNSVNASVTTLDPSFYINSNAEKSHAANIILKEIAFDQSRSTRLILLLEKAQYCALENIPFSVESADSDLVVDEKKISSFNEESAVSKNEAVEAKQLAALDFGTWLEFNTAEFVGHQRVKIAWYNSQSDRFMLSDNSGQFRVMRSAVDLAREKIAGKMRIVTKNEKPFFERALESVLMKLKLSPQQPIANSPL